MGRNLDPFFDREEMENQSDEDMVNTIKKGVSDAEDWEAENPDPQR